MTTPKITVYIPCHNYGEFVGEAIESVLRQTLDDCEIIIINDGSTDNTRDVLGNYQNAPGISIVETEGIGLPGVCNLALSKAQGEYIIRLDGDDIFDDNILYVMSAYLDRDPDLALVFPDYHLMDTQGNFIAHERRRKLFQDNHMTDLPPNGACILARTQLLKDMGGYREDLGAQDGLDLWVRIRKDHKCTNVNLPLFYYRRHDRNLTRNNVLISSARAQIKRDAAEDTLKQLRPIIAVIPCRQNYDFKTDIWKLELGGKSLLERDIAACLSSDLFDYIVVASDSPDARNVMEKYDSDRLHFFERDRKDTIRSASIVPMLQNVAKKFDPEMQGITLVRYIQTPFVNKNTLEEAVSTLAISDADSAIGVEEIHSQLFSRDRYGLRPINVESNIKTDFDTVYREARTCLATKNQNFMTGSLTGPSVASFVISAFESFFIGSDHDFKIASFIANDSED